jgi:KRAB domain-containing zinc finger protein
MVMDSSKCICSMIPNRFLIKVQTDKLHKCDQCARSFAQKSRLVAHIRVHTGDKPYKCDQCEKSFSQKRGLDRHISVHISNK